MRMSFLVIDFIIFTAAAILGFIWGAMWVDSEFERDCEYLSAEVENLNHALDALNDSYNQELLNGDRLFIALQRATDAIADRDKVIASLNRQIEEKTMTPEKLQKSIADAWEQAHRDRDN
jgi:hypothetical protein